MAKKILILTGGPVKKLADFQDPANKIGVDVTLASFSDLHFLASDQDAKVLVTGTDVASFDLVYFRMVGKRLETATLVANYAKENGVKIIDRLYTNTLLLPISLSKTMEAKKLGEAEIPLPKTFFASLKTIKIQAPKLLGFPFIIKSTTGKKAKEVWLVKDEEVLSGLVSDLHKNEAQGTSYFAQEFVAASQRIRVLVVGGKAVGAISRPTKWRKSFLEKRNGEFPEGKKETLMPVPEKYVKIATSVASAVDLDICGVDILEEDKTGKLLIIEANAAPAWKSIKKNCGVEVEKEILKFLKEIA